MKPNKIKSVKLHKTCFIFMALLLYSTQCYSQQKNETERRLKTRDVPKVILAQFSNLQIKNTIKWYKETDINKQSIEAKFKIKGKKYSVEFDTLGNLEDIETDISEQEFNKITGGKINAVLDSICPGKKIIKIQLQQLGNEHLLKQLFATKEFGLTPEQQIKYEIIARCNNQKQFEYLFTPEGFIEKTTELINTQYSNLEY